MPTIVYYHEPIEVQISMEEFMRRESAPMRIREETGRMARRAIAEYDECVAEMSAEKQNRCAKYLRTHGRDKTPADRKRDKQNRNYRMYGREEQWAKFRFNKNDPQYCRGGWDWYEKKEGQKNPHNPEMDIFRNRKHDIREQSLRKDWELEKENHAEQMRKISRLDDIAEGIMEWFDAVNDWFMDDDVSGWTYEDGDLCYGVENRIEERRLYQDEIEGYITESHKLYADEEYYRKTQSVGIDARIYLGISYQ